MSSGNTEAGLWAQRGRGVPVPWGEGAHGALAASQKNHRARRVLGEVVETLVAFLILLSMPSVQG